MHVFRPLRYLWQIFEVFLSKIIFQPMFKKRGKQNTVFATFSKTVPCEFPLLKLYTFYILYLISLQVMTKTTQKSYYTPVPNYEGGTILKHQILAENFYIWVYAPRQQKNFRCPDARYGFMQLRCPHLKRSIKIELCVCVCVVVAVVVVVVAVFFFFFFSILSVGFVCQNF